MAMITGALKSEMGAVVAHHANEGTPLILEQEDEMMHRLKVGVCSLYL